MPVRGIGGLDVTGKAQRCKTGSANICFSALEHNHGRPVVPVPHPPNILYRLALFMSQHLQPVPALVVHPRVAHWANGGHG